MLKRMASFLIPALACIGMWTTVSWASVNVYAEGVYTDSDLVVYLYVDVDTDPILSYGVKLAYNHSDLGSPVVEKNSKDWYFGKQASPLPTPNAEPDTSTPGEIIIVGCKLDSEDPQAGVAGNRVLLAKVSFSRLTANAPSAELFLGKSGRYSNFVQVNGNELDETLGGAEKTNPIGDVTIFSRGDANNDSFINIADMSKIKTMMTDEVFSIWADCNDDGYVNFADMSCVSNRIPSTETNTIIVSDRTQTLIPSGVYTCVYGYSGINNLTLESGSVSRLLNFPGSNVITIQSDSSLFTVSRSGAAVTFEGTDGTILIIPVGTTGQQIIFKDQNLDLIIQSGQVMLGEQVVGTQSAAIE
ncbi:MAG: hypothetical protein GY737_20520 [Desulfobacteraceae bacterium]|nr:hypothetical protein [Desulfobacteraceae bacterium]